MPDEISQLLASLGAIVAIVVIVHWLGLSANTQKLTKTDAEQFFALAPGGFLPAEIAVSRDGSSALARDHNERIALLRQHGAAYVVVGIAPDVVVTRDGSMLTIKVDGKLCRVDLASGVDRWEALLRRALLP